MNDLSLATQAVLHTVFTSDDGVTLMTNSRFVAEVFGRMHKDVLKAITNLECSEAFGRRNFAPSSYLNAQGKPQPMVDMTFDGMTFLVMGFTGAQAAAFKEAYIAEFNRMRVAQASEQMQAANERIAALEKYARLPIIPLTDDSRARVVELLAERVPVADVARISRCSQATVRLLRDGMASAAQGGLFAVQAVPA